MTDDNEQRVESAKNREDGGDATSQTGSEKVDGERGEESGELSDDAKLLAEELEKIKVEPPSTLM